MTTKLALRMVNHCGLVSELSDWMLTRIMIIKRPMVTVRHTVMAYQVSLFLQADIYLPHISLLITKVPGCHYLNIQVSVFAVV